MNKKLTILMSTITVVSIMTVMLKNNISLNTVKASEVKDKNVILMIGDGMSQEAITLARHYKDSKDGVYGNDSLAMDEIATGAVHTSWINGPITDSAPSATAYSTGNKTKDKHVATSAEDKPLATILEGAKLEGKGTGVIMTCEVPHATPADFTAHNDSRSNYKSILSQQVNNNLDVVLGGGLGWKHQYGIEDDKEFSKLQDEMKNKIKEEGYDLVETNKDMKNSKANKLWGMFSDADLAYDFDRKSDKDSTEPSLGEMTNKAIDVLKKNEKGFFLMVEGSKIDWAAHANNTVGIISDVLAFDEAVQNAVDFAKKDGNTVVVVTTDHGNSGISIGREAEGFSYSQATFKDTVELFSNAKVTEEKFKSLIKGKNDGEIVKLAKEYYGIDLTSKEIAEIKENDYNINKVLALRAKIGYTTGGHTGEDVYLGIYAPTTCKKLSGVVENTEVNKYMQQMIFNEEKLDNLTKDLFNDLDSLEKSSDTVITKEENVVTLSNKNTGKTLKLYPNTNKYQLNGKKAELDTVMPEIKEKLYVPKSVSELIKTIETSDEASKPNNDGSEKGTNKDNIKDNSNKTEVDANVQTISKDNGNKNKDKITKTGALGVGAITALGTAITATGGVLVSRKRKNKEDKVED